MIVTATPLSGVGIWSGGLRRHADDTEVREAAAELEELGFSALFVPGGPVSADDMFPSLDRLLGATSTIAIVTGILSIWVHQADTVAEYYASAEARHSGRFYAGLGVSHAPLVDRDAPGRYSNPLTEMRSYLDRLDAHEPPIPTERRILAALAPKMLGLARDCALGAHPYFVPVAHTRWAREQLGEGPLLAVEQAVVLETDPAVARATAREFMATYLRLPNYVKPILQHGFAEEDIADGGSDRLVDEIVCWGDETAVAARIAAHRKAGADHVCLQVVGPLAQALPRDDWRRLAIAAG
jgi:probable F420-dependent oxidoreductase